MFGRVNLKLHYGICGELFIWKKSMFLHTVKSYEHFIYLDAKVLSSCSWNHRRLAVQHVKGIWRLVIFIGGETGLLEDKEGGESSYQAFVMLEA